MEEEAAKLMKMKRCTLGGEMGRYKYVAHGPRPVDHYPGLPATTSSSPPKKNAETKIRRDCLFPLFFQIDM
jgi:hypothetical protein